MNRKRSNFTLFVVLLLAFGVLAVGARSCCVSGCDSGYSSGERSGVVIKFSKKGLVYKSWEGIMNLGGAATDSSGVVVPNEFPFSVTSDEVAEKVKKAAESGHRVVLHYDQYLVGPATISTDYVVTDATSGTNSQ